MQKVFPSVFFSQARILKRGQTGEISACPIASAKLTLDSYKQHQQRRHQTKVYCRDREESEQHTHTLDKIPSVPLLLLQSCQKSLAFKNDTLQDFSEIFTAITARHDKNLQFLF